MEAVAAVVVEVVGIMIPLLPVPPHPLHRPSRLKEGVGVEVEAEVPHRQLYHQPQSVQAAVEAVAEAAAAADAPVPSTQSLSRGRSRMMPLAIGAVQLQLAAVNNHRVVCVFAWMAVKARKTPGWWSGLQESRSRDSKASLPP